MGEQDKHLVNEDDTFSFEALESRYNLVTLIWNNEGRNRLLILRIQMLLLMLQAGYFGPLTRIRCFQVGPFLDKNYHPEEKDRRYYFSYNCKTFSRIRIFTCGSVTTTRTTVYFKAEFLIFCTIFRWEIWNGIISKLLGWRHRWEQLEFRRQLSRNLKTIGKNRYFAP